MVFICRAEIALCNTHSVGVVALCCTLGSCRVQMRIGPWREELGSPEITYNGQAGGDAAHILGHEER